MALTSFIRDFGMNDIAKSNRDTIQGNIVSTFQVSLGTASPFSSQTDDRQAGCFFGALLAFPFAERIGRKKTMIIASTVFLLGGTLMTASQGSLNMIYGGRAVAGLGIGASSMVVPVYISETAPPSIRGRLVGIFEIASQGGGMLGFWINYACDRTISVEGKTQWVVPLAIQLIPGLLLLLGVAWCPESPRYLAKKDNFEAAERILCKIRCLDGSHAYIQHEMSEIRAQVEERSANRQSKKAQFMKLFQKGVRNRMAIGLALMFLQSFTGVSTHDTYSGIDSKLFRSTLLPTMHLAYSKHLVFLALRPSYSPLASTVSRRHSACSPLPSSLWKRLGVARGLFGGQRSVAFLCGISVAMS